MYWFRVRV
jgi:hypothetical protein